MRSQNAWVAQEIFQDVYTLCLIQHATILPEQARGKQEFTERGRVTLAMLPHIERGEVEAKDLYLAYQCRELPVCDITFTIGHLALTHQFEISQHLSGRCVCN